VRVSVDDRLGLAERFGCRDAPALLVLDGRRIERRTGVPAGCRELEKGCGLDR
jgi:hypothetical protein